MKLLVTGLFEVNSVVKLDEGTEVDRRSGDPKDQKVTGGEEPEKRNGDIGELYSHGGSRRDSEDKERDRSGSYDRSSEYQNLWLLSDY